MKKLAYYFMGLIVPTFLSLNVYSQAVTLSTTATFTSAVSTDPGGLPAGSTNGLIITNQAVITLNGFDYTFSGDIIINDGTLIINNCTLTFDNSSCKLEVESFPLGAPFVTQETHSLTISGGSVLTASTTWRGIKCNERHDVTADSTHFSTEPSIDGNGDCTRAEWAGVFNPNYCFISIQNSTIQNAEYGVHIYCNDAPSPFYTRGGTISTFNGAKFINCQVGVDIGDYDGTSISSSVKYAGHIMDGEFKWTDGYPFSNLTIMRHINLHDIQTGWINLGGLSFINEMTADTCPDSRGVGIRAENASFNISYDGDLCEDDEYGCPDNGYFSGSSSRNTFTNLGYGIVIVGDGASPPSLAVRHADFTNCAVGIQTDGISEMGISDNSFDIDAGNYIVYFNDRNICTIPPYQIIQLDIKNSESIRIFKNEFNSDIDQFVAIRCDNESPPSTSSFVDGNEFTSNLTFTGASHGIIGVFAYQNQEYLDIVCNTFSGYAYDIYSTFGNLNDIPNHSQDINHPLFHASAENTYSTIPGAYIADYDNISGSNILVCYTTAKKPKFDITAINGFENPDCTSGVCVSCRQDCDDLESEPVVGISEHGQTTFGVIRLYPNPNSGILNVDISAIYEPNSSISLAIMSTDGQTTHFYELTEPQYTMDMTSNALSPGVYFVRIVKGGSSYIEKLIVY